MIKLLEGGGEGSTRYEAVTPAEIAAIKKAMVTGPDGFATHSGRWYKCVNGHPVGTRLVSLFISLLCLFFKKIK